MDAILAGIYIYTSNLHRINIELSPKLNPWISYYVPIVKALKIAYDYIICVLYWHLALDSS